MKKKVNVAGIRKIGKNQFKLCFIIKSDETKIEVNDNNIFISEGEDIPAELIDRVSDILNIPKKELLLHLDMLYEND